MKSLVLAVALMVPAAGALSAQTKHVTLQSLRDRDRVLLVFGNGNNRFAEDQLTVAADHVREFQDRNLLLVGIEGNNAAVPTALLSATDDAAARKQFGIKPGEFTVLLLGKDGGEKLRSHQPIPWKKLQETIDSMPMRQAETKNSR